MFLLILTQVKAVVVNRFLCLAVVVYTLFGGTAYAGTCGFAPDNPNGDQGLQVIMPLRGTSITVGRDVPLGAEVYRETFYPDRGTILLCRDIVSNPIERNAFTISRPLTNWSTGPYAGKVYETSVPGLGVAIHRGSVLPYDWSWPNCQPFPGICNVGLGADNMMMTVSIIKIGPVSAGLLIGTSLPTIERTMISDNRVRTLAMRFTDYIRVVSRTCTTPDVTVPMGEHKISDFTGINSATPWLDFSVRLNDCPAFNGFFRTVGPTWTGNGTEGVTEGLDTRKQNVISIRIDPTRTPWDASLGILALNPSPVGSPQAASGIGLQVARIDNGFPLGVLRDSGIVPRTQDGASYSIPLRARYIQRDRVITAGPANATVTFTIDYN